MLNQSNAQSPLHRAAQAYARKGFPVFPVRANDKVPDTRHGFKDASTAPEAITRWWSNGQRNIGLATGNNLVVIDIDVKGDADGKAAMQKLISELGELPDTLKSRTPSGGEHWLFHYPEGVQIRSSANQVARGVDIRADGGYIVAPPSKTNVGKYEWSNKDAIADLPAAWLERLQQPKRQPLPATPRPRFTGDADELAEVRSALQYIDAHDHDTWVQVGLSLAGSFGDSGLAIWDGWSKSASNYSASEINKRWKSFSGSSKTKASIFGMAQERGWQNPAKKSKPQADLTPPAGHPAAMPASMPTTPASMPEPVHVPDAKLQREALEAHNRVRLKSAASITPKRLEWVWQDNIPKNKLSLVVGAPKTGKTMILISVAAMVSSGSMFPDGTKALKGGVIFWTGEDDLEDTIIPRLKAAGADLNNVHFPDETSERRGNRPFDPSEDMPALIETIEQLPEKPVLLVIDPIVSTTKDMNDALKVRKGLQPVIQLAQAHGMAALGITHFRKSKSDDGSLGTQIIGSSAFLQVARTVFYAVKPPDAEEGQRVFFRGDTNIAAAEHGFTYAVESAQAEFPEHNMTIDTAAVVWGEKVAGDELQAIINPESGGESAPKRAEAETFLQDMLANGECLQEVIQAEADKRGISAATLRRAKKELNVKSAKAKDGSNKWVWHLPETMDNPANNGKVFTVPPHEQHERLEHVEHLHDKSDSANDDNDREVIEL